MNYFLLLSILTLLTIRSSNAQNFPEPSISEGHSGNLTAMVFNSDGTRMATAAVDKKVKIWDLQLNKEFRTFLHFNDILSLKFSPDGNYLAVQENSSSFYLWDIATGNQLLFLKDNSRYKNTYFFLDESTLSIQKSTKQIEVYSIPSGTLIQTISNVKGTLGYISAIKLITIPNPEEGDYYHTVFDRISGQTLFRTTEGMAFKQLVCYDEGGTKMAQNNNGTVELFDFINYKKIATVTLHQANMDATGLCFTKDGKQLLIIQDDYLQMIECTTGKTLYQYQVKDNSINTYQDLIHVEEAAINPNNKTIAIITSGISTVTIQLIDGPTGLFQTKFSFPGQPNQFFLQHLSISNDQKTCVITNNTSLKLWNMERGEILYASENTDYADQDEEQGLLAFSTSSFYGDEITVVKTSDMSILSTIKGPIIRSLSLSGDGNYLATVSNNGLIFSIYETKSGKLLIQKNSLEAILQAKINFDGNYLVYQTDKNSSSLMVLNLTTNQLAQLKTEKQQISEYKFHPGNKESIILSFYRDKSIALYDYKTLAVLIDYPIQGYPTGVAFNKQGTYLATSIVETTTKTMSFPILVMDTKSKSIIKKIEGHSARCMEIKWGSDGKSIYSIDEAGFAKVRSIDTPENELTMVGNSPSSYMMLTKDNYYKSPKNNSAILSFRYNGKLYEFDQFDYLLNRPDKVLNALAPISDTSLASLYYKAYQKRLKMEGVKQSDIKLSIETPTVTIRDKQMIPIVTASKQLKINFNIKDPYYSIASFNVYINNVPLYGKKGFNLRNLDTKSIEKEIQMELSGGKNYVEISAINEKGNESLRESFTIEAPKTTNKDLYVLAIGVSKFYNASYNLVYPVKDVNDFVGVLRKSTQFNRVNITTLLDSMVTLENIKKSFTQLKASHPDDLVVLYFSTHGVLANDFSYYLATHGIDFQKPSEKGLSYETLLTYLDDVPARNRLILLDACNSGQLDNEETELENRSLQAYNGSKAGYLVVKKRMNSTNAFDYMKLLFADLTKKTGCQVLAGAAGNQAALETNQYNNSIFTYALVEGLTNFTADKNKDTKITMNEWSNYVQERVYKLSSRRQKPTLRDANELIDFIVY